MKGLTLAANIPADLQWDTAFNLPSDLVHLIYARIENRPCIYQVMKGARTRPRPALHQCAGRSAGADPAADAGTGDDRLHLVGHVRSPERDADARPRPRGVRHRRHLTAVCTRMTMAMRSPSSPSSRWPGHRRGMISRCRGGPSAIPGHRCATAAQTVAAGAGWLGMDREHRDNDQCLSARSITAQGATFSAGQVDSDLKRSEDNPAYKVSLRQCLELPPAVLGWPRTGSVAWGAVL